MFSDLKDKVVVVTGGVTGIGGAASLAFAGVGAKVLAQYLGGGPELETFKAKGIATLKLDLTGEGAPQKLIDEAINRFGRIDVLVNNAGSLVARIPLEELTDDFIGQVFDLNCRQLIHCTRLAADVMKKQGSGNIINVSSIAARNGASPGASVYGAAKAFVSSFSKTVARELVGHNIRVNCVSPGTIHTSFHDRFSDEAKREAARKSIPMGRLGLAEDCAGTFLYLASDSASGYVTGQVIEVNGGQLIMSFVTRTLAALPEAIAPDGSEVRLLAATARGSMAHFRLPPHAVSKAVAHRSVEEVWYFVAGSGRMWRSFEGRDEVIEVLPGVSISIPVGAKFQFRCDSDAALEAIGVTMPPWPGLDEAFEVDGVW